MGWGKGSTYLPLLGASRLHSPSSWPVSPPTHPHTHRCAQASWLSQAPRVLRTCTGQPCVVRAPRASAQTPAWRRQGLCPPAPSGSQLCSCCRLLGHSRPGAVPEYARLLLPQGARLHHGETRWEAAEALGKSDPRVRGKGLSSTQKAPEATGDCPLVLLTRSDAGAGRALRSPGTVLPKPASSPAFILLSRTVFRIAPRSQGISSTAGH